MAHLTNGTMSYERRLKTGDFEHKHAAMTINYAFQDNDPEDEINELLARARTLVVQHVHQALRGNKEGFTKTGPAPVGSNGAPAMPVAVDPVPGPDPVVDPVVVVPDELNRGFIIPESFTKPDAELLPRTTIKDALETEILHRAIVAAETPEAAMANFIPMAPNLKAAKRAVKKRPVITDVVETPLAPVIEEVVVEAEDFTAVAPAPTDAELQQVLSRVSQRLQDRPRIVALLGEFVQSGQSYPMIPTVRRTEFVTRLEALV